METIIHILAAVLYTFGLIFIFVMGWIFGHRKGYKQATTDYRRYLGEELGVNTSAKREVESSGGEAQ